MLRARKAWVLIDPIPLGMSPTPPPSDISPIGANAAAGPALVGHWWFLGLRDTAQQQPSGKFENTFLAHKYGRVPSTREPPREAVGREREHRPGILPLWGVLGGS